MSDFIGIFIDSIFNFSICFFIFVYWKNITRTSQKLSVIYFCNLLQQRITYKLIIFSTLVPLLFNAFGPQHSVPLCLWPQKKVFDRCQLRTSCLLRVFHMSVYRKLINLKERGHDYTMVWDLKLQILKCFNYMSNNGSSISHKRIC